MNNTIIFLSILILFLSAMLIIKIDLDFDINQNIIIIKIRLYNIKFLVIKISLIGLYYQINNSKKLKKIKLIDKKDLYLIKQIKKSVFDKLYYDNIALKTEFGLISAKDTALIIASTNILCEYINNYIKLKNTDTFVQYENMPNFIQNKIKINLQLKVYFTIFDMLFAVIISFIKRGQYVKQKK